MRNARRPLLRSASLVINTDLRELERSAEQEACVQTARGPPLRMPQMSQESLRCTELHLGIAQKQAEIDQLKDQIARSRAQIEAAESEGLAFREKYDRKLCKMLAALEQARRQNLDVIRESDKLRSLLPESTAPGVFQPNAVECQASKANCTLHREVSQLGSKTLLRRNRSVVMEISHSAQIQSTQAAQKRLAAQAQQQLSELESEVASAQATTRQLQKQLRVHEQQAASKAITAEQLRQLCCVVLRVFRAYYTRAQQLYQIVSNLGQPESPLDDTNSLLH